MDPDIRRALVRVLGVLTAVLLLAGTGVWGAVESVQRIGHTSGYSGTPGRIVATHCVDEPGEEYVTAYCVGTFRPDGGGPPVERTRVDGRIEPGVETDVRCDGDGRCHVTATSGALFWYAALMLSLAAVCPLFYVVLDLVRLVPRTLTRRPQRIAAGIGFFLAACAVVTFLTGVVVQSLGR